LLATHTQYPLCEAACRRCVRRREAIPPGGRNFLPFDDGVVHAACADSAEERWSGQRDLPVLHARDATEGGEGRPPRRAAPDCDDDAGIPADAQVRFLLPRLLGKNVDGLRVSADSDELAMTYLDYVPEEYFELWKEKELLSASTLYDAELSTVLGRYIEIERELEHEPRGERRTRLVNELYDLKLPNRQLRRARRQ
jgi:hypothetical protein